MTGKVKKILVLAFFCQMIGLAQTDNRRDCRDDWETINGVINITLDRDDCDYEIEDWDNPNGLVLNIAPLVAEGPPVKDFQFRSDLSDIYREGYASGRFRTFEVLTANGDAIFYVELSWKGTAQPNNGIKVMSFVNNGFFPHTRGDLYPFAIYEAAADETVFEIQLSWKPREGSSNNGWLDLSVNGEFVARRANLRLEAVGNHAPFEVRYGNTKTLQTPLPQGRYFYFPWNPSLNAFHL